MITAFTAGHALLIGAGGDLPDTVTDAEGLAGILQDPGRCAYPPAQVHLLTGAEATRPALLTALDDLAQKTDDQATVFIYFSGHGYRVEGGGPARYYLLPHSYDLADLEQTAIDGSAFAAKLRALPAQKLLLVLDCCHAGGVGAAKVPALTLKKAPLPPEALPLLRQGRGRVLIASSQEDEYALAGTPYSVFTAALIEALCGEGVAQKDGYVRVSDVALHAREVVPARTKKSQHPILHFEQSDNFVLAYYAGGDPQPKGVPFEVGTQKTLDEEERAALRQQLAQHRRNLRALQQQAAIYTVGTHPLHLLNQIDHEKQTIQNLEAQLEA